MAVYKLQIVDADTGEVVQQDDITPIEQVNVEITNTTGTPSATGTYAEGVLDLHFEGVKGEDGEQGEQGEQGIQGIQGDSAVYNPEDPSAPDFVMANTTGDSTTKAMTQKAVTDALNANGEPIYTDILEGTWEEGKFYREDGSNGTAAASSRIAIDVSEYVGRTIKLLTYTGSASGVQRCLFWNGSARVGNAIQVSTANTVKTLTVPTGAVQLRISNVPATCPNPYVKAQTGTKLAIEVAQENRTAIATINGTLGGIDASVDKVEGEIDAYRQTEQRSCYYYTIRTGYYVNQNGTETANDSYRLVKNIPADGISVISATNIHLGSNGNNGWHFYNSGGTWLGCISKTRVKASEFPANTATLKYTLTAAQTQSTITITWDGSKVVGDGFTDDLNARKAKVKTLPYQINSTTGEETYDESFPSTPFIELRGSVGVYCPDIVLASGGVAFYDENKDFISCTLKNNFVKVPNGARYAKVRIGNKAISQIEETTVTVYGDAVTITDVTKLQQSLSNILPSLKGKKMGVIGDSISASTYGQWINHFQVISGVIPCVVAQAGQYYGSGQMAAQARNLDSDCDFVVMFAGTNDYGHDIPVGEPILSVNDVQVPNSDTDTTAGGMSQAILDIYATCGTIPVIIMTPMPRPGYASGDTTCPKNAVGKWMSDYVDCIIKVAEFYSLPVLDLFHNIGLPANVAAFRTAYFNDYVHPKPVPTHMLIAKRLYKFLMDVMDRW